MLRAPRARPVCALRHAPPMLRQYQYLSHARDNTADRVDLLCVQDRSDTSAVPLTVGVTEFPPEKEVNETLGEVFQRFLDLSFKPASTPTLPAATEVTEAESKQA
jgi:hypothetical protein